MSNQSSAATAVSASEPKRLAFFGRYLFNFIM
jgi:hypothetical protein